MTVAVVASFLISSVWYAVLGRSLARLSDAYAGTSRPPAWHALLELARASILAAVLAVAADRIGVTGVPSAILVALLAWAAFPLVLLSGSVLHERVPWRLAAIHAGDWLLKLPVVMLIVGLWR
ncbi:DUF1761 domain-containing protein [Plantactinospora mayteni]|uniref:DUF1761 domain-containing protein n=1 Tax=Plantactinospora mayteni TaxID=566021 RepID=UPI001943895A|nr:DUF1761 domain-containing protein [Plantactinospora mayteni]